MRKDEARPLVGVGCLLSVQFFDTCWLDAGKDVWPVRTCATSPKVVLEYMYMEEENPYSPGKWMCVPHPSGIW